MALLHTSCGKWSKVEKSVMVPTSYERSDNKKELEMVPTKNNYYYHYYNILSDSNSEKEAKKNFFYENC